MKLEFSDIIDREKDSNAIVIGLGPSLANHISKIKEAQKNNFIVIACNDVDRITDIPFNYWVLASSESTVKKIHDRLNQPRDHLVAIAYADSVDLTPRNDVDKFLSNVNYLPYDQRHFGAASCFYGLCCHQIIPGRLTIQEECKKYTGHPTYDTSSDTVAIQMLYLAVLLGCKNIYVTGVDLDYKKGYVDNRKAEWYSVREMDGNIRKRILQTISVIRDSAKNIGTNIYCMDQGLPISDILEFKELP